MKVKMDGSLTPCTHRDGAVQAYKEHSLQPVTLAVPDQMKTAAKKISNKSVIESSRMPHPTITTNSKSNNDTCKLEPTQLR